MSTAAAQPLFGWPQILASNDCQESWETFDEIMAWTAHELTSLQQTALNWEGHFGR